MDEAERRRLAKEIGRRTIVVGIFPNDPSAVPRVGALLIEQNDEWIVARRYLFVESMTLILDARQFEEGSLEQQLQTEVATLNPACDTNRTNDELERDITSDGLTRRASQAAKASVGRRLTEYRYRGFELAARGTAESRRAAPLHRSRTFDRSPTASQSLSASCRRRGERDMKRPRRFAVTLVAGAALAIVAPVPAAQNASLLRLNGVGPLKLGMRQAAALKTGWLTPNGSCAFTDIPSPISYRINPRRAPAGVRGVVVFFGGRLTNMYFSGGVRTSVGIAVGKSTVAQMVRAYRRGGFKVSANHAFKVFPGDTTSGTTVEVVRKHDVVLDGFAPKQTIKILGIPTYSECVTQLPPAPARP